ncbi:MAG: proteasome accessory factor PafA2 family protein, partial [Patescibacteria group bacterium]
SNASVRALQRLEYQYHRLGERSLFRDLVKNGCVEELISEDDIRRAMKTPPETRALARSKLQQFFDDRVLQIAWHFLAVLKGESEMLIRMPDPSKSDFDAETFRPKERA